MPLKRENWPDWPALMRMPTAAKYLDMPELVFTREVAAERLPSPIVVAGRRMWLRYQIDERLEMLGSNMDASAFDFDFA